MLLQLSMEAVLNEDLGKHDKADVLNISLSSLDYIGHAFGPNSVEVHDSYIRLDKDLDSFLSFLDSQIGKGNYVVVLSSDHGVADLPDTGLVKPYASYFKIDSSLTHYSRQKWGANLIRYRGNQQIYLDQSEIKQRGIDIKDVKQSLKNFMLAMDEFDEVWLNGDDECQNCLLEFFDNGGANGDIVYALNKGLMERSYGTTHGTANEYDTHVPCIFFGKNIQAGSSSEETHVVDIAPTFFGIFDLDYDLFDGIDRSEMISID